MRFPEDVLVFRTFPGANNAPLSGTIAWEEYDTVLVFTLDPAFESTVTFVGDRNYGLPGVQGNILMVTAESGLADPDGNALDQSTVPGLQAYHGIFAVRDATPPVLLATNPADGATQVPTGANIDMAWSKPMRLDSLVGRVHLRKAAGGADLPGTVVPGAFYPATPLEEHTRGFRGSGNIEALKVLERAIDAALRARFPGVRPGFLFRVFSQEEFSRATSAEHPAVELK